MNPRVEPWTHFPPQSSGVLYPPLRGIVRHLFSIHCVFKNSVSRIKLILVFMEEVNHFYQKM
jgi:hypothetical protein